jgi:hypothetical protein
VLFLNRSTHRTTRTRQSQKGALDDVAERKVPATRGFLLCVATLVVAIAASVGVASPADSATARMAVGSCDPKYPGHAVSSHVGYGYGWVYCDTTRFFNYTVRLYNASGSILAERSSSDTTAQGFYTTPTVGCAGAYVHGFIYVNYAGTGKNNTEQTADLC